MDNIIDHINNIPTEKLKGAEILFFSDMDGTFLKHDKTISEENLAAVKRLSEAGGRFIITTGRVIQASKHYFEPMGNAFPAILCNGGMIYDCASGKVMWSKYLDADTAKSSIEQLLEEFPDVCAEICTPNCIYDVNINDTERGHWKSAGFTAEIVGSIDEVPRENWSKVLFAMKAERIESFAAYCRTLPHYDKAEYVTSGTIFHEMLPKDCSKGSALKRLPQVYHIENPFTVAMGDYDNDIEMLQSADLAVCPANARDNVKAVCAWVTRETSEENAVAGVIDTLLAAKQHGF